MAIDWDEISLGTFTKREMCLNYREYVESKIAGKDPEILTLAEFAVSLVAEADSESEE